MQTEFLVYCVGNGRPTVAADGLHDLEEARLFSQYLAVYERIPERCFYLVAENAERLTGIGSVTSG
jgi:hypothetical protein